MLDEHLVHCPYCGEAFTALIDVRQGSHRTIEDCYVCCRPIEFSVEVENGELLSVYLATDND